MADPPAVTPDPSPFTVRVVNGSSFRGADLAPVDTVILADVPQLSSSDRRALAQFVNDGGGLLILPGPSALPAFYNGDLLTRAPVLLPARLGPARAAGSEAPALDLARADHPALARFRGATDIDLTTARFERYFQLGTPPPSARARVVCPFTDGAPALEERSVGLGRVMLLAAPPLPGWSTLPFKPAFLPFLHSLVAYLGQGSGGDPDLHVGDPLVWRMPGFRGQGSGVRSQGGPGPVTMEGPEGERMSLRPARGGTEESPRWQVRWDEVSRAGLYHLLGSRAAPGTHTVGGRSGAPGQEQPSLTPDPWLLAPESWFAVNLRAQDSDLRPLSRRELEGALRPAPVRWVDPREALAAVVREGRQGREAWRGLLLAVLALMLCESGMAQRFGRRRGDG
jgi:hypothetical protein